MSITSLSIFLIVLIACSGFFAAAETALMAVNPYRLRHQARSGAKLAKLILKLLERPDRLLGVILIGNTACNIIASALATVLCVHIWGGIGVLISTISLTFFVLIFAEVLPKTYAALHAQGVASWVAVPLEILQNILYPLVWLANLIANGFLFLCGVRVKRKTIDALTAEELRSIVHDSGPKISSDHQDMLLGVLGLTEVTVDDIMTPRQEIIGIDLNDNWQRILKIIINSNHTRLLVYKGSMDDVQGILHLRQALHLVAQNKLTEEKLIRILYQTYYVPSGTPLNVQLLNFKNVKRRTAIVVNEYGDVQGMVTLENILEEIVGEFTAVSDLNDEIHQQLDGSYIINGSLNLRELNRELNWDLPTTTAKTVSGLIIETLEMIPVTNICLKIDNYQIEILKISDKLIKAVKIRALLT